MVACFPGSGWSEKERKWGQASKTRAMVSFRTWPWKWHTIMSAIFSWSHRSALVQCGRRLHKVWAPGGGDPWGPSWRMASNARYHRWTAETLNSGLDGTEVADLKNRCNSRSPALPILSTRALLSRWLCSSVSVLFNHFLPASAWPHTSPSQ